MLFYSKIPILKFPEITYQENCDVKSIFKEKIYRIIDSFCVSEVGRVEAVHLSPNLKKIAYASFDLNKIIIFDIEKEKEIFKIKKYISLGINLNGPHDFAWIDNSTLAIANRNGPAIIFSIDKNEIILEIDDLASFTNSVEVIKQKGHVKIFFCNTKNFVSQYEIDKNYHIISKNIFLEDHLKVPDGISSSPSKENLAITSALNNKIFIYNLKENNFFEMQGSNRPHGITFITDDIVLSSEGGSPFINVWNVKDKEIKYKIKALSKKQFNLRGSKIEGGIKGICFHPKFNFLFLTCPNAPFLIFDINELPTIAQ